MLSQDITLEQHDLCRSEGGDFSLPSNLAVSIQQLLHALDCACAESEADCSSGERREEALVKQDHLLDCIMSYVTRYILRTNQFMPCFALI